MSNFSNIGFKIEINEDLENLVENVCKIWNIIDSNHWKYILYEDKSGAELRVQMNNKNNCIWINPHFNWKSNRMVFITNSVIDKKRNNILDWSYFAYANPHNKNDPESWDYPFVFDLPNFWTIWQVKYPTIFHIQLIAFPYKIEVFENETSFLESQTEWPKYAPKSFIPIWLFWEEVWSPDIPRSHNMFTGEILEVEKRKNEMTWESFYWFLVDTLGWTIDIVVDIKYITREPKINNIVSWEFWLSGKLINPPQVQIKKSFFQKLFQNQNKH